MKYNQPLKYKEICKEMDDEVLVSEGTNRKRQLKRWQNEYEIEKVRSYYFIKRELTDDEKYLKANENSFKQIIENLLMWYLNELEEDMAYLSYDALFGILKMVNGSYHTAKMHKNDEIDSFDTKSFRTKDETDIEGKYMIARYLSIFFDSSENIMKDSLEYVLKDMVNKNMILLGNGFKTYKKELVNSKWIWRTKVCSTAENAEIMKVQDSVLHRYGLEKNSQFYYMNREVQEAIRNDMREGVSNKLHCDFYSKILVLTLSKDVIAKDCEDNNLTLDFILSNKYSVNKLLNSKCKEMLLLPDSLKKDFIDKYVSNQFKKD